MHCCNFRGGGRSSSALCCLLLALAALLCWPGVATADHPNDTPLTAVLGEKPPELEDVTVQVQDTQGPQLIVENTTKETLEIHDAEGVPFLRIGPEGVEANRKAKTFYDTYGPEGIPLPEEAREATDGEASSSPDWRRVSEQRSWGWFDHRLQTEDMQVPEEVSHAGEPANFGDWGVPARLGKEGTALEGSYRYEPEPKGTYVANTTSEPEDSEIAAQLSQGYGGATALLLQNEGEDPLTVLDSSGEPAIEIGPDEVRVNTSSPVGREASRVSSTGTTADSSAEDRGTGDPEWQTVSGGSSFTWQDPRLRPPGGDEQSPDSDTDERQEVARWEIPLEFSGESYGIEGVIEWQPLQSETTTGSGESGHDHSSHDHSEDDDEASANSGPVSGASVAAIVPAAGILVAASAGGALLYRRWRA